MAKIDRRDFIHKCIAMGVGIPFLSAIPSLDAKAQKLSKVLIVGAGAAGLTAGYILNREGVNVQILEASPIMGGRVKRLEGFAPVPLDSGAEWIHTDPSVLQDIVDNPGNRVNIETIVYNPKTISTWSDEKLNKNNWVRMFYSEYKFKSTTWYGFFEKYIAPSIQNKITFNSPVTRIDYSGDEVLVKTSNNKKYTVDKVLITVPVKILQSNLITFTPSLPKDKKKAIDSIYMGDGIKVFIEFSKRFYPDIVLFGSLYSNYVNGESKTYYDAVFGKGINKNILGLFAINQHAKPYVNLNSDKEIIAKILAELDEIFAGQASKSYVKHATQNWSKEPFVRGSYSWDFDDKQYDSMAEIFSPVQDKIYFAGEAMSEDNQATVHGACESAFISVEKMFQS